MALLQGADAKSDSVGETQPTATKAVRRVSVRGCGGDSERGPRLRCGVGGGGHRINRLGWSCEASTIARRGPDDRGEIGAV